MSTLPMGAHVVGLSLGGAVALSLAARHPRQVASPLVTGTSAGLGRLLGGMMKASAVMYGWFPPDTLVNMAFQQFGIPAAYHALLRDDLRRGMSVALNTHMADALTHVEVPADAPGRALVLVGGRETFVAKGDARKLARAISGAQGALVPGVGHVWNLEAPELFNRTVRAFASGAALPPELRPL